MHSDQPTDNPLLRHAEQASEALAVALDYWRSLAPGLRALDGSAYPYDLDEQALAASLAEVEEHVESIRGTIRVGLGLPWVPAASQRPAHAFRQLNADGRLVGYGEGATLAEAEADAMRDAAQPGSEGYRLIVATNNAITNDPCAICGQRCDPCGLDIFLASTTPNELVCDACASLYAPALLAARSAGAAAYDRWWGKDDEAGSHDG
jgi:hypothetical protein